MHFEIVTVIHWHVITIVINILVCCNILKIFEFFKFNFFFFFRGPTLVFATGANSAMLVLN